MNLESDTSYMSLAALACARETPAGAIVASVLPEANAAGLYFQL